MFENSHIRSNPEIFWVLSSSTNSGKTTLSKALIRYLNRNGHATVGFKPLAGGKLRDIIDFAFTNYPLLPNSVFGSDGLELCRASPLTTDQDVDLVSPWQLIFYQKFSDTVIIRTGSMSLGNVEYFKSSFSDVIRQRSDIIRVNKILNLPFDKAVHFDINIVDRSILAAHVRKEAFQALLERKPSFVVVESAGPFVPYWQGTPKPDHLIFIDDFSIRIYPHVGNFQFGEFKYSQLLESELKIRKLPSYKIGQFYAENRMRAEIMEKLLALLLKKIF